MASVELVGDIPEIGSERARAGGSRDKSRAPLSPPTGNQTGLWSVENHPDQANLGEVRGGGRLHVDPGVALAYLSGRCDARALVLGDDATIRSGSVIYAGTSAGHRLATGHNVVIREECELGDDVAVWSNSIVDYGCVIGDRVKIHSNCYVAQFTLIGDDAFLAPGVSVANDLYPGDDDSAIQMAGPIIEAGAQIGAGVTLLPFVRIGAGAVIGSGSVVSRDVPPGMVAFGNPARVARAVADLPPIAERIPTDHPLMR